MQYFINDHFVPANQSQINVQDLGLLRGYGIFDFFRVIDGKPIFCSDHLDRFETSAAKIHLNIPYNRDELQNIIAASARMNSCPMLGIKLIVTGGYSTDGYTPAEKANFFVLAAPFSFKNPEYGMCLLTAKHSREMPDIKSINYAFPIRLLPEMRKHKADDVLYYDENNYVSELSRSNLFIVKNGIIATPKAGVLYGITRKKVMEIAQRDFVLQERAVTLAEVLAADEVFTTGSTKRVTSIVRIDHQSFQYGGITKQLQQSLIAAES